MTDTEFREAEERHALIQQMWADIMLKEMDSVKRWQDIRFAPVLLIFGGAGAATGLIAATVTATVALLKWIH